MTTMAVGLVAVLVLVVIDPEVTKVFGRSRLVDFARRCRRFDSPSAIAIVLGILAGVILTPVHGVAVGLCSRFVAQSIRQRRDIRVRQARTNNVITFVESLAHRLRSGDSLRLALKNCANDGDVVAASLSPLVQQHGLGAALKIWTADNSDFQLVSEIERSIRFAMHNGTPVVVVLEDVLQRQYRVVEIADETRSLIAQASSSARLLAILPAVFGVLVLMIDPRSLTFLFTSTLGGVICLAALLLEIGGVRWMNRVLQQVESS